MEKTRLLRQLKKEAYHIKKKIRKTQDPTTKQRLKKNYSHLISIASNISKART